MTKNLFQNESPLPFENLVSLIEPLKSWGKPCGSKGKESADVLVIGEAPGTNEERAGVPFVGASGMELDKMLHEAGFEEARLFFINVCPWRPPQNDISKFFYTKSRATASGCPKSLGDKYPDARIHVGLNILYSTIRSRRWKLIICLGNTALWATSGNWGISKWRGSLLFCAGCPTVATYHPASVLRQWSQRALAVHDLKKARRWIDEQPKPDTTEFVYVTDREALDKLRHNFLGQLRANEQTIALDLETTRHQFIRCIGLGIRGDSRVYCIPLQRGANSSVFSVQDEICISEFIRELCHHPNAGLVGQNFLYDLQYLNHHYGVNHSRWARDTMIYHHTLFPALPKGLDFLSALYLDNHVYWKDEGKDWDTSMPDERMWDYNCKDVVATLRIDEVLEQKAKDYDLEEQCQEQMLFAKNALKVMHRGCRIDTRKRKGLLLELESTAFDYERVLEKCVPELVLPRKPKAAPWYRSNTQQKELFYDVLGIKPVLDRKTKRPTCNDSALQQIGKREPLVRPLTSAISIYRSLEVLSNTLRVPLDYDGRLRCSYNTSGTITFRFSSSESAFGTGTNLQNVTKGTSVEEHPRLSSLAGVSKPNLRKLFVPDFGYVIFDCDFKQADARVVAWEADDEELKAIFRDPNADLHMENAKTIYGPNAGPRERQKAKAGVHAVNYGVRAKTLAKALGITVHQADAFIRTWLEAHPGIANWHETVANRIEHNRRVTNAFGYGITFFDRVGYSLVQEALAWIGQSTVAIAINKAWAQLNRTDLPVEVLLQVHDSLVMQAPRNFFSRRKELRDTLAVKVPYDDPLIMEVDCSYSQDSWGDVKGVPWE